MIQMVKLFEDEYRIHSPPGFSRQTNSDQYTNRFLTPPFNQGSENRGLDLRIPGNL